MTKEVKEGRRTLTLTLNIITAEYLDFCRSKKRKRRTNTKKIS